jgi:hypothetical protein
MENSSESSQSKFILPAEEDFYFDNRLLSQAEFRRIGRCIEKLKRENGEKSPLPIVELTEESKRRLQDSLKESAIRRRNYQLAYLKQRKKRFLLRGSKFSKTLFYSTKKPSKQRRKPL